MNLKRHMFTDAATKTQGLSCLSLGDFEEREQGRENFRYFPVKDTDAYFPSDSSKMCDVNEAELPE